MPTTRIEKHLRLVSDQHMDDSAGEIDLVDDALALVVVVRHALLDGTVTLAEATDCLAAAERVYGECVDSLERNVAVESGLTAFAQELRAVVRTTAMSEAA